MNCPYCNSENLKVTDSRPVPNDNSIRRRRECIDCGMRFTTFEAIQHTSITVVKKDGSLQLYDRQKLISGIARSCQKRPITRIQMEEIAQDLEVYIQREYPKKEINSAQIGDFVLKRLKDIDLVSYIRFASVYREFQDINSFVNELKLLEKEEN